MLGILSLILLLLSFLPLYFITLTLLNNAYEGGLQALFFGLPFLVLMSSSLALSFIDLVWVKKSSLSKYVLGVNCIFVFIIFISGLSQGFK